MQIEKFTIYNTWGNGNTIATVTDLLEIKNLFTGEMLCAETDFYYRDVQYFITEVHLMYLPNKSIEVVISVEIPKS